MELFNNLYKITSETSASASGHTYTIKLNPEHFIYKAHFPGEPITPGVCILQIAVELLSRHIGFSLQVDTVKNVKFLKIITPVETPDVVYTFQKICTEETGNPGGDTVSGQVTVTASNGEETFAKLSLLCKKPR